VRFAGLVGDVAEGRGNVAPEGRMVPDDTPNGGRVAVGAFLALFLV
jgi:hypothetical protein